MKNETQSQYLEQLNIKNFAKTYKSLVDESTVLPSSYKKAIDIGGVYVAVLQAVNGAVLLGRAGDIPFSVIYETPKTKISGKNSLYSVERGEIDTICEMATSSIIENLRCIASHHKNSPVNIEEVHNELLKVSNLALDICDDLFYNE